MTFPITPGLVLTWYVTCYHELVGYNVPGIDGDENWYSPAIWRVPKQSEPTLAGMVLYDLTRHSVNGDYGDEAIFLSVNEMVKAQCEYMEIRTSVGPRCDDCLNNRTQDYFRPKEGAMQRIIYSAREEPRV